MSAIGGVFYFDRTRRVEPSLLRKIDSSLHSTGPDGSQTYQSASVGLVYRPFHTTPESLLTSQPVVDGDLVATFDGRLDNISELRRNFDAATATDCELFLKAYRTWGTDCFSRMIGDFVGVIWNSVDRKLTLVRDPWGVKKLFYTADQARVLWSSDIAALLDWPDVSNEVDEYFVGMCLTLLPEMDTTAFKEIRPVIPGQYITFTENGSRRGSFWGISNCLGQRSCAVSDTEEHLRSLLSEAVRSSMRSSQPVTAELSGGYDSSTIVCIANQLRVSSECGLPKLNTISVVYDKAHQSDERQYIRAVEQHVDHLGHHIREDDFPILSEWPDPLFVSYPNRLHCFGNLVHAVHATMNSLGSRVLLSGLFGDQLFVSSQDLPYDAVDSLRQGKIVETFNTCYRWSSRNRQPLIHILWHAAVRPNLPLWLRPAPFYKSYAPQISRASYRMPNWLNEDFVNRTSLMQRIKSFIDADAVFKEGSYGIRFANLMQCVGWFSSGYMENQTSSACIEMRYPYLYRPLVEFLISLPYRTHCDERSGRRLQKRALNGILPEEVRHRSNKRGPFEAILRAANKEHRMLNALAKNSRLCEYGFADKTNLVNEVRRWRSGHSTSDMLKFLAVEMWLRALENRRSSPRNLTAEELTTLG